MLKVLFFAQTRELIGISQLDVQAEFSCAEELRQHLSKKGKMWALALEKEKLLVAINQTLCSLESPLKAGDEVAFFPPVTGG